MLPVGIRGRNSLAIAPDHFCGLQTAHRVGTLGRSSLACPMGLRTEWAEQGTGHRVRRPVSPAQTPGKCLNFRTRATSQRPRNLLSPKTGDCLTGGVSPSAAENFRKTETQNITFCPRICQFFSTISFNFFCCFSSGFSTTTANKKFQGGGNLAPLQG